jgi:hypothetical protein
MRSIARVFLRSLREDPALSSRERQLSRALNAIESAYGDRALEMFQSWAVASVAVGPNRDLSHEWVSRFIKLRNDPAAFDALDGLSARGRAVIASTVHARFGREAWQRKERRVSRAKLNPRSQAELDLVDPKILEDERDYGADEVDALSLSMSAEAARRTLQLLETRLPPEDLNALWTWAGRQEGGRRRQAFEAARSDGEARQTAPAPDDPHA